MAIQEGLLAILLLAAGAIALLNNLVKEGAFIHRSGRRESELIELSNKIRYLSENSRDNHRNALIFKKMTGRRAPIHTINLILNCYDPHLATYIYAKAPRYIQFQKDEISTWKLVEPGLLQSHLPGFFSWLGLCSAAAAGVLSGRALGIFAIGAAQSDIASAFNASAIVLLVALGMSAALFRQAYKEIVFLRLVSKFYAGERKPQHIFIRTALNGASRKVDRMTP